jgi:hypothetical protein
LASLYLTTHKPEEAFGRTGFGRFKDIRFIRTSLNVQLSYKLKKLMVLSIQGLLAENF